MKISNTSKSLIFSVLVTSLCILLNIATQDVSATTNTKFDLNSNDTLSTTAQLTNSTDSISVTNANNANQMDDLSSKTPLGNSIIHTQYLNVTKASIRESGEDYFSTKSIAGSLINTSDKTIEDIQVYAALFDEANNLYAVSSGSLDYSSLKPNEDSPFKIDVYSSDKPQLDHFMLLVSGSPVQTGN